MTPADLSPAQLQQCLGGAGVWLDVAAWRFHLRSSEPSVRDGLQLLYRDYPLSTQDPGFSDFHVAIMRPRGLRRWWKSQVVFEFDDERPFQPFPVSQSLPMLEWGMNWCVSSTTSHMLIVHAAVLERAGRALVMPAPPGHGKSTLCAALVSRGWRLLSDELALIELDSGLLHPFPRPISLKNRSIAVIQDFAPEGILSNPVRDTVKGDIAYLRPPADSVRRAQEAVRPGWVVFPRYGGTHAAAFERLPKVDAFKLLAEQAFNYHVLGRQGFEAVSTLIDSSDCLRFEYHALDAAVAAFALLAEDHGTDGGH